MHAFLGSLLHVHPRVIARPFAARAGEACAGAPEGRSARRRRCARRDLRRARRHHWCAPAQPHSPTESRTSNAQTPCQGDRTRLPVVMVSQSTYRAFRLSRGQTEAGKDADGIYGRSSGAHQPRSPSHAWASRDLSALAHTAGLVLASHTARALAGPRVLPTGLVFRDKDLARAEGEEMLDDIAVRPVCTGEPRLAIAAVPCGVHSSALRRLARPLPTCAFRRQPTSRVLVAFSPRSPLPRVIRC